MKFRQKPNGIWVVDYDDDQGKRRRVSTGIKSPPQRVPPAEVKAAGREIVLGVREPQGSPLSPRQARSRDERLTMRALFDKCQLTVWHPDNVRSQRTIVSNVNILNRFMGDEPVEAVTYTRLEQLVTDMKAHGYKPATIKRKLAMVGKALKMATMWTDEAGEPLLRAKPPLPKIVVNNLKDRIIEPREEEAIWAALEKRRQLEPHRAWFKFRVLLGLLFDTGGRLGESIHLGPKALSQEGNATFLTFPRYRTKSGKPRTLPLAARSVAGLGSLMDHLTLDRETGEWRFFGFAVGWAVVMFRQLRDDVFRETGMDLSDVTLHTIRHTTLTRLARGGMGLAQLQLWAGHSDPKITAERYLHLNPSDLVGGLDILNRGTLGDTRHDNGIKPVTVPDTLPWANRANPGTATVQ